MKLVFPLYDQLHIHGCTTSCIESSIISSSYNIVQVEPFASLVSLPHLNVPRLLINREVVGPFRHRRKRSTDVAMTGDLVECVSQLADIAGWTQELDVLVKGEVVPVSCHFTV